MLTPTSAPTVLRLGTSNVPILKMTDDFDQSTPMNILLWGKPGCGKTVLASTACTPILFVQFDQSGYLSLKDRPDCFIYDLSSESPSVCYDMMRLEDAASIQNFIKDNGVRTLVFDSLTTYYWLALRYVVGKYTKNPNISIETPSQAGYAQRNSVMHQTLTAFMGLTAKLKLDTIMLLHEGNPQVKTAVVDGRMVETPGDITPSITMNALNLIGVRVSEIWHMTEIPGGHRQIELRPVNNYSPMKTRMFATPGNNCVFNVPFNAVTGEGDGISAWVERWRKGGGRRIALPR